MKTIILLSFSLITSAVFSQNTKIEKIISLGKYYSSHSFGSSPSKSNQKEFGKKFSDEWNGSVNFIKEASIENNKLLTEEFLELPDSSTLKVIYIIDALHQNPHKANYVEPKVLVDSLLNHEPPFHELVDEYYSTLFTAVSNKNKPFNLSKVNFKLDEYGLDTDLAKSIFYLRCMEMCGKQIFGYMNIVKPPNTEKALSYINRFPKFNGLEYFKFTDLYFEDFQMEIFNDKGLQSYKDHFIDELYSTLLNHLICLSVESKDKKAMTDLILGSILKDKNLYMHSSQKSTLEGLFEKQ